MRYIPNSPEERNEMLREMGYSSIEELFRGIPESLRLKHPLDIPAAISEPELIRYFRELSAKNTAQDYVSFIGGGVYQHHIPVIIDTLISRSEFYTSYTPYQPEIAQGTLQAIFEFQTMIAELTGCDIANASMYDGSTALAEAVLLAQRVTGREGVLMAENVHPEYQHVVRTYLGANGREFVTTPYNDGGRTDWETMDVDGSTAAVVVQSPNFFGVLEDIEPIAKLAHDAGALLIVAVNEPLSLAMVTPPGQMGADIVAGEAQSFGVPANCGGPFVGFFAARERLSRQMPGRLVSQAYDDRGRRGFVLTLATREQHIRREKATSNICTNQGLCMLMATIYLETFGRRGLQELARHNMSKAAYAARRIAETPGYELRFKNPCFNEFVVRTKTPPAEVLASLRSQKIVGGIELGRFYPDLKDCLLIAVTEVLRREDIDKLADSLPR